MFKLINGLGENIKVKDTEPIKKKINTKWAKP